MTAKHLLMTAPAAGGGTVITEDWNAADSASIDNDLSWTITAGSFDLISNAARPLTNGSFNRAIANPAIGSDLVYAQVECNTGTAAFGVGPVLCHNNSGSTGYYAELHDNDNRIYLNRSLSKVANATMTVASNTTYLVRIEMDGGDIRILVDGVEKLTYTDSSPLTGTYAGIQNYNNNNTARFDNFEAGTL